MSAPSRFPLAWPSGWPRKHPGGRMNATFKVGYDQALKELGLEIERLGGRYPILSTNLELRVDGTPRRDHGEPRDRGVAVYFELKGKQKVFACETFTTVKDNIRAIGLTIAALRAMERFGATEMLERTLNAFDALPAPKSCWEILGLQPGASAGAVQSAFTMLALKRHPDKPGGSHDAMSELNAAREQALKGGSP